ncbi:MAG: hypothetical protein AAFR51_08900 [Pseudomonadota bacterium]
MLSLREAALRVNKGKSTLQRAIKKGKLTATRNDDGNYEIDESELARVYPEAFIEKSASAFDGTEMKRPVSPNRDTVGQNETALLRLEIEQLRARLQTVETMSAREIEMAHDTIEDYRKRLDEAASEKRTLTHLLEHHTEKDKALDKPKGFFGKLFA